jgi:hypothetical protein
LRLRTPLCCLTSDTHSLSVLLLGHITIPFSREQHKLEIVKEYPSRSNLNCLIVVLRGLGRKGDEFLIHSGLSTSIGWGKPLSTSLLFQRTYFLICFTKICNHFWFAKHFVNYFLFFLRSFFSTLKSTRGGNRTRTGIKPTRF